MSKAAKRSARRPFIDAAHAAELLGCDPRTVRKWVEDGRLEGEKVRSSNDRRFEWRIFTDQPRIERARSAGEPAAVPAGGQNQVSLALAELRAATAEDRARRAESQNSQIVAALHAMNDVLGEFQKGAELAQQSNAHFQAGSAAMSRVMSALLDSLAAGSTPDSPEGLERP